MPTARDPSVHRARRASRLWAGSLVVALASGCGPSAPRSAAKAPRAAASLDLARLADDVGRGAPPIRPIWPTLPEDTRRAIEQRLSRFASPEQRLAELDRRGTALDLRDDAGAMALAEQIYLLESLAFGPPSASRTQALSRLAALFGVTERMSELSRWAERVARSLGAPERQGALAPFVRALTEGGELHRAYVAETLRAGAPDQAVARALLSHAWYVQTKDDLERARSLREAAVRVDPEQPAAVWITLGSTYAATLDPDGATLARQRAEGAPPGDLTPKKLVERLAELDRAIARAREVKAAGAPTTPEARLALGVALSEIGADARAAQVLTQARDELPRDARPIVALARLTLRRAGGKDLSTVARQIGRSLDVARQLDHRTSELYEILIGVSGLTAVEDVLAGGKDPAEIARRARLMLERLRAANGEHAALAPERAAVLDVVLGLGAAGVAEGPGLVEALPALLRDAQPRAREVMARYPTDPAARAIGVGLAAFAADPAEASALVRARPEVPDPPALVVTRAEIALDLALMSGEAAGVEAARALADELAAGDATLDARIAALRGDVEVVRARAGKGSLAAAERHYRDALRGLPPGEKTRVKANLAWVLAETGRVGESADAYRDAVNTATSEASAGLALVAIATLGLERQPEDALSLADKALALDADNTMARLTRAVAEQRLGRVDDARDDARRAFARIDRQAKVTPRRLWGQTGAFSDATLDFELGIASDSPRYNLRLSAFHRVWWLRFDFRLDELRALSGSSPPAPRAR
ncbi:MAG: hypothetical protein IT374_14865 [Polyangiaceae bacterium]|nr:hypothetical protein [Polyangiaceae bacterium]